MDEEFDTSVDTSDVDTSADMDTSDVVDDVSEDIPEDVPEDEPEMAEEDDLSEDIPEDVPEDELEAVEEEELSDDVPEDVPEEQVETDDVSTDVDNTDSAEPIDDTKDELLDDNATDDTAADADGGDSTEPIEDTQDEPMDDNVTEDAADDTAADVDNGDCTEPTEDTQDEPLDDTATENAADDTTADVDNADSAEPIEDTQDELLDDTATENAADDTTTDVDNADSAEPIEDTQDELLDDTATEDAVDDTAADVDNSDCTEPTEDTQDEPLEDTTTDDATEATAPDANVDEQPADTQSDVADNTKDNTVQQNNTEINVEEVKNEDGANDTNWNPFKPQKETKTNTDWNEDEWGPNPFARDMPPRNDSDSKEYTSMVDALEKANVDYRPIQLAEQGRTEQDIINRLSGGDMTKGSCSSLALAYAGNKAGYDVLDFRDGDSRSFFSSRSSIQMVADMPGVNSTVLQGTNDIAIANQLLSGIQDGKEYYLATGGHAAIVMRNGSGYQYLELQHPSNGNGWQDLSDNTLSQRFGCRDSRPYECSSYLMEVDSLANNSEFRNLLGYINTAESSQKKGVYGNVR